MNLSDIGMLISIVVYLILMIVIGYRFSKQNRDAGDFYLGGRKLGPYVTAMSAEASDMSGWLLMGLPGVAYFTGLADAGWTAIGLAVGTYFNWLIVSKRLRRYSEVNNSITVPDFFSNRFKDKSKVLLAVAALIIVVFFVPYTASGFAACGKLFSGIFDISYGTAMIISAVIIVAYTALGGFLAASTTDFVQSIVMTAALVGVLIFGVIQAGGVANVLENAEAVSGYLSLTNLANVATGESSSYNFLSIISTMAWGLGYCGMPHILLRFMAIKDDSKLKVSRRVGSIWVVIAMAIALAIGIIGFTMSQEGVIQTFGSASEAESIIVKISDLIASFGFVPALLAGIVLAGIMASTMSTADSQLLAASSSVSENILKGVFNLNISKKGTMILARVTVIVVAVIAVFLAWDPNSSVFSIVSFSWAGFGAAFGPLMLFSLFWKRANRYGAIAGVISGGAMVFIWKFLIRPLGGAWNIYELLPAFIVSCIFIVVVSLITPAPGKDVTDDFEKVAAMK